MSAVDPGMLGAFDGAAPVGLAATAIDGALLDANDTLCRLAGRERSDVVGRLAFSDLLTVGGRIYFETHLRPMLLSEGSFHEVALDLLRPDGERVPVLAGAVRRDDRLLVAVLAVAERRDYERALLEARERAERSAEQARELALALARSLLPPRPPDVDGLEVAAAYQPAGDGAVVGGDFYDVFQLASDRWVALIGDVCGKGPAAAAVTGLARHTLRAAFVASPQPDEALRVLHEVLLREQDAPFCSLSVLVLDRRTGGWAVTHSTGGHALPLVRRADGTIEVVGDPGSLVGAMDQAEFTRTAFRLDEGDLLLLHTDGVSEARRGASFFGDRRVLECLRESSGAAALVGTLVDRVLSFQEGPHRDDVAVLAMRASRG